MEPELGLRLEPGVLACSPTSPWSALVSKLFVGCTVLNTSTATVIMQIEEDVVAIKEHAYIAPCILASIFRRLHDG